MKRRSKSQKLELERCIILMFGGLKSYGKDPQIYTESLFFALKDYPHFIVRDAIQGWMTHDEEVPTPKQLIDFIASGAVQSGRDYAFMLLMSKYFSDPEFEEKELRKPEIARISQASRDRYAKLVAEKFPEFANADRKGD